MTDFKRIIPCIVCQWGNTKEESTLEQIMEQCRYYSDTGADELLIFDKSENDKDHEQVIRMIKELSRIIDVPMIVGGRVNRLEDIKKYLYAGAKSVFLDTNIQENVDLFMEASNRFGSDKIYAYISAGTKLACTEEYSQIGVSAMVIDLTKLESDKVEQIDQIHSDVLLICKSDNEMLITSYLKASNVQGVILPVAKENKNCMALKQELKLNGIAVDTFESAIQWKEFNPNCDGHVPVIVQDYKTSQVLMLAYMNEDSFQLTIETGKMYYFSRSRQKLWLKGETSGHYQYVKSLTLDCDRDTILAKVSQVGPACHTGKHSCFHNTLAQKEYQNTNPLKIFEDVYHLILDRKEHPKEGSYTNYLFDKGIDKILKKLGEESTEIIIAAKNPDPEEIKYEISDFLYHMMVLMADKNVTWEDITEELARR